MMRLIELERRRLARELHTGIGQLLAAIRIQAEVVSAQLKSPAPPVAQALQRIETLSIEALDQVRALAHSLYPPDWERIGLADALQQLCQKAGVAQKFAC